MKGLSSGAFAKTTSLAHPTLPRSPVASAISLMIPPMIFMPSMLIPALVVAIFTLAHTRPLSEKARGVAGGHPLVDQREKAADEVNVRGNCRLFQCVREGDIVVRVRAFSHQGNR